VSAGDNDSPVDLLLAWQEAGARRESSSDSVASLGPPEGVELRAGARGLEADPAALTRIEEAPPDQEYGPELFEWSADREQALIDALEQSPEGAVPRVHAQLEGILEGLQSGGLPSEKAALLVAEVEIYLAGRLQAERCKRPVADEDFMQSRADKLNALIAWQESAAALREYLEHGEAVQLKVAAYAAEQANSFLTGSREVLMACEPELDEEDLAELEDAEGE
jgi:hypothetical protein